MDDYNAIRAEALSQAVRVSLAESRKVGPETNEAIVQRAEVFEKFLSAKQ